MKISVRNKAIDGEKRRVATWLDGRARVPTTAYFDGVAFVVETKGSGGAIGTCNAIDLPRAVALKLGVDEADAAPVTSGPTQPEAERKRGQVLLRLDAAELAALDALAERWGLSRSETVARAVSATRRATPPPTKSREG